MAFFGVEVKPTEPFTHSSDKVKGRLRISQATLGIGSAAKKSLVQCNVGNKTPVLLCVLMPDKTESCHLDLEFEEAEDVVFSVIGPRSVYLTGYYVNNSRHYNMNSDTESYGEDIGNTESEKSNHSTDEDEYEDSFINDDEPEVLAPSPVSSDGVDMKTQEDNKPKDRKGNPKRLKKRYQVIESDDETSLEEDSDNDDNYLLSVFKSKRTAKTVPSEDGEKTDKLTVATGGETEIPATNGSESKEKAEAVNVNGESVRKLLSPDGVCLEKGPEKKEKDDSVDTHNNVKVKDIYQNMPVNDVKDQKQTLDNLLPSSEVGCVNCEKPKKKRKERSKDVKILEAENGNHEEVKAEHIEADSGNVHQDLLINHKKQNPITDMEIDAHPAVGSENGPKSKKRRKELEGQSVKGNHAQSQAVKGEQGKQDIVKADNMSKDVPATTEEDQIPSSNKNTEVNPDLVAEGCLSEKKTKRKKNRKSKTQGNESDLNMVAPVHENSDMGEDKLFMKFQNKHVDSTSSEVRTLSNGLIIEELAKGEPDGKVAAPGRKVKVYYTAKLKENGHVFDSNIGKSPYKFRLGDEEIIEGWNLGLDGMHVGDKRRLIIPPSMGYGNQGAGENVPPNSWLVYDVELLGVRR